ncbi:pyruvate dehydrogenase phosphatase regulatory subunit, mitochondrial-like isoform X2 [Lineus longissimus]|uniref:pyruvate dehydrogenase phosphatase regulatory subunit, mitochondrial-like isoform X2 n=1 Tax=Lineus longissimus TaxID=88925 RepID=UPI002B4E78FD
MIRLGGFRHLTKVLNQTLGGRWQHHLLRTSGLQSPTLRKYGTEIEPSSGTRGRVPSQAQIVVCGGGVVGCSVAYHLALEGWKDVIILEQGSISCGTTWHAAALLGQMRATGIESHISKYSLELYNRLEKEGYAMGIKQCGSLNVARTKDRMVYNARNQAKAATLGIETHVVTPREIKEMVPLIKEDDLEGGLYIPGDGAGSATDICMSLSRVAKENGVKIFENCQVERVLSEDGRVSGVDTNRGRVTCDYFVNCSGQWARCLGKVNTSPPVSIPLHPCQLQCIITRPLDPLVDPMMPVIRDYDGYVYFREWSGGILAGGFEPQAKPVFHDGIPPKFEFQLLPEDWDHFQILLENMLLRMPGLAEAEIRQLLNGPESFTADGRWIIGEAPEIENYFVAAGMCSSGIVGAGGIGKILAEWLTHGDCSKDAWPVDIRRFVGIHNNKKFLRDRVRETLKGVGSIAYPRGNDFHSCRKLRTSPLYTRLAASGAWFGGKNGFERAMYFRNVENQDESVIGESKAVPENLTFYKPGWFENVEAEFWACREGVCLIDMSSFTKFELKSGGREVVDALQYICANEVDQQIGTVIHTGMLNKRGGYENDCSLVRMGESSYFMIAPTTLQTRSFHWLQKHLPKKDRSVLLSDVTSMYTCLNVIGPKAQELLEELTDTSMEKSHFQSMTCKEINLGNASGIRALRLTHTGEDGFVLYIPSEYALHVYDSLMTRGRDYGIRNAGYYALRALRIEKFFAYWGLDINPDTTPFEVGRDFRVKFDKGDFIGREALLKEKEEGIRGRLVHFTVEDHDTDNDPWSWGGEPIYRNGKFAGFTTSSCFGYTMNRLICLGLVRDYDEHTKEKKVIKNWHDWVMKSGQFEIDINGKRFPAKPSIYPPKLQSLTSGHGYVPKSKSM